jgi:hypothetical protein
MKKIKITEQQFKNLVENIIKEEDFDDFDNPRKLALHDYLNSKMDVDIGIIDIKFHVIWSGEVLDIPEYKVKNKYYSVVTDKELDNSKHESYALEHFKISRQNDYNIIYYASNLLREEYNIFNDERVRILVDWLNENYPEDEFGIQDIRLGEVAFADVAQFGVQIKSEYRNEVGDGVHIYWVLKPGTKEYYTISGNFDIEGNRLGGFDIYKYRGWIIVD